MPACSRRATRKGYLEDGAAGMRDIVILTGMLPASWKPQSLKEG